MYIEYWITLQSQAICLPDFFLFIIDTIEIHKAGYPALVWLLPLHKSKYALLWHQNVFEGRKFSPLIKNDSPYRWAEAVQTEHLPLVHWPHHAPYAAGVNICCYLCYCSQREAPIAVHCAADGVTAAVNCSQSRCQVTDISKCPKPWHLKVSGFQYEDTD